MGEQLNYNFSNAEKAVEFLDRLDKSGYMWSATYLRADRNVTLRVDGSRLNMTQFVIDVDKIYTLIEND